MRFVCDAPDQKAWFRIENEAEAAFESALMNHAVEKYFLREYAQAVQSYQPPLGSSIERDIGLNAHVQREMPLFLTLRDREGKALATAMLPPGGREDAHFRTIIVGQNNSDPFPTEEDAIRALGAWYGIALDRAKCYPYLRYGL